MLRQDRAEDCISPEGAIEFLFVVICSALCIA